MIDDDFSPDRNQLRALGELLRVAQHSPFISYVREGELYNRVYRSYMGHERRPWLDELEKLKLIKLRSSSFRAGDRVNGDMIDVCITAEGIFYIVSRAPLVAGNARGLTDDFNYDIADPPWTIQAYYSPPESELAPSADNFVRFDHNQAAYDDALNAIDAVFEALKSDNEIGANSPEIRDEKLDELRSIRCLLEKKEGWQTKIISVGWGALGFLATHFAERPVGQLAEYAWHALQVVIGIR